MELRQLTSERERRIFGERMEEARAKKGARYRETRRSAIGKIHLEYGLLYGLFEHDNGLPEEMMSGLLMHDLASFPQSFPQPAFRTSQSIFLIPALPTLALTITKREG